MAALPNAMQNAKTYCVGFTPYPLTIALPYELVLLIVVDQGGGA